MRKVCLFVMVISLFAGVSAEDAATLFANTGVKGGLVVHLGVGDGTLTADLHANDSYVVHGLEAIETNVLQARALVKSRGLYGKVTVDQFESEVLPYNDNFVNLLVSENLGAVSTSEVLRVLVPNGVAYIKNGANWDLTVKPRPANIDEWTHYLHDPSNNALADDDVVAPPNCLQWRAKPDSGRSHEYVNSVLGLVTTEDRFFAYIDYGLIGTTDGLPGRWKITARSTFNGVLLWEKALNWEVNGGSMRSGRVVLRSLVAVGDDVFVVMGKDRSLFCLDAATGEVKKDYGVDFVHEILCVDGKLVLHTGTAEKSWNAPQTTPANIVVLDVVSGEQLWTRYEENLMPCSLSVVNGKMAFHNYNEVVLCNLDTGTEYWSTTNVFPVPSRAVESLVLTEDAVLITRGKDQLARAFSTETGEELWAITAERGRSVDTFKDLFVTDDDRVWFGSCDKGYDLLTGAMTKTIAGISSATSSGHHNRCYRSKATSTYFLFPKRGVEFIDRSEAENHARNDWVRSMCQVGFMPANGMLYSTSDPCACYPGVSLKGFNALRNRVHYTAPSNDTRLIVGEAFASDGGGAPTAPAIWDWSTYRHDARRSGNLDVNISVEETNVWETVLGGDLTPPTYADGKLYVCDKSNNTLYCLNGSDGSLRWEYSAAGVVDLPPTLYNGTVLFGSCDGWVYCLRADDGALSWKYRAAPEARLMFDNNRLASPWPVHGSICILNHIAYFAAGRSSFLDGGIYLYGLNPSTGEKVYEKHLERPYPEMRRDKGEGFDMLGTLTDVLVTDGTNLYMLQMMFDQQLNELEAPEISNFGDRKMGRHLMTSTGFLDGSCYNRTHWSYSERWQGFYFANQAPKAGQILVFDDDRTFGVKYFTTRNVNSPLIDVENNGYLLFADQNQTEPGLTGEGDWTPVKWLPTSPATQKLFDSVAVNRDKGTGFTRDEMPVWSDWKDIRVQAMVGTRDALFVMGPPDVLDSANPYAAFDGDLGSTIQAVSKADGTQLLQMQTESQPVFDGMIAADGKLFVVLENGKVICPLSGSVEGGGIEASSSSVIVPEGSTNTFGLRLTTKPDSNVTVTVAYLSGDADLSVQSGSDTFLFTTNNWMIDQYPVIEAAQDDDFTDGTATLRCSASGMADLDIIATEDDDDIDPTYSIPWEEPFDDLDVGDLAGQHGWTGGGTVQTGTVHTGTKALSLQSETASHTFLGAQSNVVVEFQAKFVRGAATPTDTGTAVAIFSIDTNGYLVAYSNTTPIAITSTTLSDDWHAFKAQLDYTAQTWDMSIDDTLLVDSFAFYSAQSSFQKIAFQSGSQAAFLDEIYVANHQLDTDGDGIPDAWEKRHYGGKTNAVATKICANGINTVRQAYIPDQRQLLL